jgi:hypothetical protein
VIALPLLTSSAEIATEDYPLRASALPRLLECPASVFLTAHYWLRDSEDDLGGEASQTGNLVHAAAAVFHREPGSAHQRTEAGKQALEAARSEFPGGDAPRARKIWERYAADPQNIEAEAVRVEEKVVARLDPAPWDVTRKPIVIRGTLDQLRYNPRDKAWQVCDIKTGRQFYGPTALNHYITQQAAYVLGARQTWGHLYPDIEPGALICTDGYFRRKGRVFWWHQWSSGTIPLILQSVVTHVAAARMKALGFQPGDDVCKYCEYKNFSTCSAFYKDHVT